MSVLHTAKAGGLNNGFVNAKKWFAGTGACALLLMGAGAAHAQQIRVIVNHNPVHFGEMGPQQVGGRVLVPVRGVLEQLGADVSWHPGRSDGDGKERQCRYSSAHRRSTRQG